MKRRRFFSALKKLTGIVLAAVSMFLILTLTGCSNNAPPIISNSSSASSTTSKKKYKNIKKPEDLTDDDFNEFNQIAADELDERIKGLLDESEDNLGKGVSKLDIIYSIDPPDANLTYNQIKIKSIDNVKFLSAHMFADMNTDYNHVHSGIHCDKYFIVLLFSADISAEGTILRSPGDNIVQNAEGQYVFAVYFGSPQYLDNKLNYKAYMSSYHQSMKQENSMVFKGGVSEEEALEVWNEKIKYDDECQYTHTKLR